MSHSKEHMVAVIGGGISGLYTAYRLLQKGYSVHVFEKSEQLGGIAGTIPFLDTRIERFYHFICRYDRNLICLLDELNLKTKLKWRKTAMNYHVNGKFYPFTDPIDLMKFDVLSCWERLRFGLSMLPYQVDIDWKKLDKIPNDQWLTKWGGSRVYDVIWRPLMEKKYYHKHRQVPAAWVWGRTKRRSRSRKGFPGHEILGYIEGNTDTLTYALAKKIFGFNGQVHLNSEVRKIAVDGNVYRVESDQENIMVNSVISTVPAPMLAGIVRSFSNEFREKITSQEYLGVVCPIIAIEGDLSSEYWTNIYEMDIPYLGIIQYSLLNKDPGFRGLSVAYLPIYCWPSSKIWNADDEDIRIQVFSDLRKLFPSFDPSGVKEFLIHRERYGQPMIKTGHLNSMLPMKTELKDFYLLDSSQIYPEDRGLNNCIRLVDKIIQNY